MQAWTLVAGLGCGVLAHVASRVFSRGIAKEMKPPPRSMKAPPSQMDFPFSTNNKMVDEYYTILAIE